MSLKLIGCLCFWPLHGLFGHICLCARPGPDRRPRPTCFCLTRSIVAEAFGENF